MTKNTLIRLTTVAVISAAVVSHSAIAVQNEDVDLETTKNLYEVCSVERGAAEYIPASFACRAFIEATVQYHDAVSDRKNLKPLICYPKTVTVEDGRAAFVAWAERHASDTELMSEVPVIGLVRALSEKYPCK